MYIKSNNVYINFKKNFMIDIDKNFMNFGLNNNLLLLPKVKANICDPDNEFNRLVSNFLPLKPILKIVSNAHIDEDLGFRSKKLHKIR